MRPSSDDRWPTGGPGGACDRRRRTVSEAGREQTGFVCHYLTPKDLGSAIARAVDTYLRAPDRWRALVRGVMQRDFSWAESARKYVRLYERAVRVREGP